jgi:hypothetical protein
LSVAAASEDKKQIGLTLAGSQALSTVMEARIVAIESDAYRLAIAYALGAGMDPGSAPKSGYQTKFNAAGGVDVDGQIRDLIAILLPEYSERPYATAERLAELGMSALAKRITERDSVADVLLEVVSESDDAG